MNTARQNGEKQVKAGPRDRKSRISDGICYIGVGVKNGVTNLRGGPGLVLGAHNEQDVRVRETSLLEFHYPRPPYGGPQHAVLGQVVQESTELEIEDPGDDVWPIVGALSRQEATGDLGPRRVRGEGDEVVRLTLHAYHGHSVQVVLLHVPRATGVRRRQNHPPSDGAHAFHEVWALLCKSAVCK